MSQWCLTFTFSWTLTHLKAIVWSIFSHSPVVQGHQGLSVGKRRRKFSSKCYLNGAKENGNRTTQFVFVAGFLFCVCCTRFSPLCDLKQQDYFIHAWNITYNTKRIGEQALAISLKGEVKGEHPWGFLKVLVFPLFQWQAVGESEHFRNYIWLRSTQIVARVCVCVFLQTWRMHIMA